MADPLLRQAVSDIITQLERTPNHGTAVRSFLVRELPEMAGSVRARCRGYCGPPRNWREEPSLATNDGNHASQTLGRHVECGTTLGTMTGDHRWDAEAR